MTKTKKKSVQSETPVIERVVNDDAKLLATFAVGDVSHQGDLIIVAIDKVPPSAKRRENRQLADGDTQGSRHVVERGEVYDADPWEVRKIIHRVTGCDVEEQYIGPVFVSPADPTENDLTHPEHGNQGYPAGTVCAVVFQRNLDAEEQAVRSRD